MTAYDRCQKLLKELQVKFGEVGLSFGYIGNCGIGFDDRSWYFFTKVLNGRYCFQFGGYRSNQLDALADKAERELETWVREKVQPKAADRYRYYCIKGPGIRHQRQRLEQEYGFSFGLDALNEAIVSVRRMTPEQVAKALPGFETYECDAGGQRV